MISNELHSIACVDNVETESLPFPHPPMPPERKGTPHLHHVWMRLRARVLSHPCTAAYTHAIRLRPNTPFPLACAAIERLCLAWLWVATVTKRRLEWRQQGERHTHTQNTWRGVSFACGPDHKDGFEIVRKLEFVQLGFLKTISMLVHVIRYFFQMNEFQPNIRVEHGSKAEEALQSSDDAIL